LGKYHQDHLNCVVTAEEHMAARFGEEQVSMSNIIKAQDHAMMVIEVAIGDVGSLDSGHFGWRCELI
jgi:hypothetical protein